MNVNAYRVTVSVITEKTARQFEEWLRVKLSEEGVGTIADAPRDNLTIASEVSDIHRDPTRPACEQPAETLRDLQPTTATAARS